MSHGRTSVLVALGALVFMAFVVLLMAAVPTFYLTSSDKEVVEIPPVEIFEASKNISTDKWEADWELKMAQFRREFDEGEDLKVSKMPTLSIGKLRRYNWGSPAETRAELWNIPEVESKEAAATAFLRICVSEASGHKPDCLGIWQVVRSLRSKKCDRARLRNITECDDSGETYLSTMRRVSKSLLGVVPPRTRRQRWVSELKLDCEPPESWPMSQKSWDNNYKEICDDVVELALNLMDGKRNYRWPIRYARPVAWGGRCESTRGACDDRIACQRGLVRLQTNTYNAFWCKPPSRACPNSVDPVCIKLGFPPAEEVAENGSPASDVTI